MATRDKTKILVAVIGAAGLVFAALVRILPDLMRSSAAPPDSVFTVVDSQPADGRVEPSDSALRLTTKDGPGDQGVVSLPRKLTITTEPEGADLFLDWEWLGATPLTLSLRPEAGTLLVQRRGYRASWLNAQTISIDDDTLELQLKRDNTASNRTILLASGNWQPDNLVAIKTLTREAGLIPIDATPALRQAVNAVGQTDHPAVMAWARARFDAGYLIDVRFFRKIRDLGQQPLADSLRNALSHFFKADVTIELSLFDLRTHMVLGTASAKSSGSALDGDRAWQRALESALEAVGPKLAALIPK